jgi:hypothetical protein
MNESDIKELIFSLAWYDCSAHHNRNVKDILAREFPGADFSTSLEEFDKCKNMPPGPGCPR